MVGLEQYEAMTFTLTHISTESMKLRQYEGLIWVVVSGVNQGMANKYPTLGLVKISFGLLGSVSSFSRKCLI